MIRLYHSKQAPTTHSWDIEQKGVKMYHIANDPRARKSAELIAHSVLALSKNKSANQLSIAAIQRVSSVSRSTFYRLFDTPVDVLLWQVDKLFDDFVRDLPLQGTRKSILFSFFQTIMEHAELFAALEKCSRLDALAQNHRRYFKDMGSFIGIPSEQEAAGQEYLIDIMSYLLPVAISTWIHRGQKDTPEEVYHYFWQSIRTIASLDAL